MADESLTPFAPGTITECPRCGVEAKGMSTETEFKNVYPLVEMWPGGPLMEAIWETPTQKATGHQITLKPCGDVFRDKITLKTRRADA